MDKKALVKQWVAKAENDLKTAKIIANEKGLEDIACFHAQQAVEKFLKAYLTYREVRFPKTYNISYLLRLCCDVDQNFFFSGCGRAWQVNVLCSQSQISRQLAEQHEEFILKKLREVCP